MAPACAAQGQDWGKKRYPARSHPGHIQGTSRSHPGHIQVMQIIANVHVVEILLIIKKVEILWDSSGSTIICMTWM